MDTARPELMGHRLPWIPAFAGMTKKKWMVAAAASFLALLVALLLYTAPPPLPSYAQARTAYTPSESWLYDRHGRLLDTIRVDFAVRRLAWTPLDRIAPVVGETIVAAEDRRFAWHGGVDYWALAGALRDRWHGRRTRGASTLSMQLAAFLAPDLAAPGARGWRDKLRQMRAGWALERRWTKPQILEAYLNLAGWRGEQQGIAAAAQGLFGKSPAALSRDDALLLAALLPAPQAEPEAVARRACLLSEKPAVSSEVETRSTLDFSPAVARPSTSLGTAGCDALENEAFAALGPTRRIALDPGLAPHLATRLLDRPGMKLATTLDARVQALAAQALRRQLIGLGDSRARDGAVVVLDNASGDVLAYVGGVGGGSTAAEVDGAAAYRQAGSTLKPFLYAGVIEKGYLAPASILDDSPVQLDTASGLYVPQNYDREFKGPVSARTALAGSLNVPAVRTLLLVGVDAFRDRLWDAGYRGLTEDGGYYGFSLALGSAEVTLLEQAAAYRALAQGGAWSPPRLRADDPRSPPRRVFSRQAAWITADMLADPGARAITFGLDSALRLPFWAAVKTGTSKAMRDNWCVGFSDRYTVAVWGGNVEGDAMRAVSGTSGAAPVWGDILLALHDGRPSRPPAMPEGVEEKAISYASAIEQPRREYFLKGTGMTLIAAAPGEARRPRITNPVSGSVYAIDPDIPIDRQRLAVAVTGDAITHRLLLDREDLGDASSAPLILPGPGRHKLALLDLSGKVVDQVVFTMR